jgi:hypothetical protein
MHNDAQVIRKFVLGVRSAVATVAAVVIAAAQT